MYNKTILDNGIRVITEHIPSRTISVGVWIDAGSRDETNNDSGCAHFVEHMLFKGTPSRNASQIARQLDNLGGMSNAFTSKDTTCLYGTVLDAQVPVLLDLFSDLCFRSLFDPQEIERERQVILQEICMVEDTPEELIHERFSSIVWAGHPLGRTVLGQPECVSKMSQADLQQFTSSLYTPERIIIAAAGNIDHQNFINNLPKDFLKANSASNQNSLQVEPRTAPTKHEASITQHPKDLEQSHILLGTYAPSAIAKERYQLALLNILLGGNMSSRLFQEIREKRGLVYSIYSHIEARKDSGVFGIYAGTSPDSADLVISLIKDILKQIYNNGISDTELDRAKSYAKAGMYLAAESNEARMTRLAQNELLHNRYFTLAEVDQTMTAVTSEEINHLAADMFSQPLTGLILGPES